jgi:hypothetical protein
MSLDANSAVALATQGAAAPDSPAPQVTPDAPSPTPAAAPVTPEPFLRIDDRNAYADKDAAIKGWTELKAERTRLSKWEEYAKEYGVNDPAAVKELFNELLEHRQRAAQATPAAVPATVQTTFQAAIKGDQAAYAQLPADWRPIADQWIAHNAELRRLGYVTEDALKPVMERLDSLTSEKERSDDARVEAAIQRGTSILTGLLKEANLPNDEKTVKRIGDHIGNELYSQSRTSEGKLIPGSPEHRFLFGTEAEQATFIKDALSFYTGLGEAFHTSKTASYASSKTAAQNQAPRSLPAQNAPAAPPARTGRITPEESQARVRAILEAAD